MKFIVPGIPVAQPRQRHKIVCGHVQNYTPTRDPVNVYKAAVQAAAAGLFPAPLQGPVRLDVRFLLPRPKNKIWKKRPMPREPHTSKPDEDNLVKAVKDALKGIAFRDDAQVWICLAIKQIADGDEQPHTEVEIHG